MHILKKEKLTGYKLMKKIEEFTGFWKPSPGSIYPLLKTMEKEKLIKRTKEGFEITKKGLEVEKKLEMSKKRWEKGMIEFFSFATRMEEKKVLEEIEKVKRQNIDEKKRSLIKKFVRIVLKSDEKSLKKIEKLLDEFK